MTSHRGIPGFDADLLSETMLPDDRRDALLPPIPFLVFGEPLELRIMQIFNSPSGVGGELHSRRFVRYNCPHTYHSAARSGYWAFPAAWVR